MVKIQSSKTDHLVIACTRQVTCLIAMVERYCCMGEVDHSSQELHSQESSVLFIFDRLKTCAHVAREVQLNRGTTAPPLDAAEESNAAKSDGNCSSRG